MRYLVTGKQMKEIDRYTIETIGIPSLVLMERAAYAFVEELKKRIRREDQIWAVCGNGNNGADGVAAARMLFLEGYQILVILARGGDRGSEEYLRQVSIARNLGMNLIDYDDFIPGHCDVLIDAVFGVGLSRPVEGVFYDIITSMSQIHPRLTAAVDIPSGVCADTGKVMGTALKADLTVTFGYEKIGTMLYPGKEYSKMVVTADIGFPQISLEKRGTAYFTFEREDVKKIPSRPAYSNKGTFGRSLIVAGSENMGGAAYLSALSAYRTGAGLVKIFTVEENRIPLQTLLPEAVMEIYDPKEAETGTEAFKALVEKQCRWADGIVLGPGLGRKLYAKHLVEQVLINAYVPIVLDADGLNLISDYPELTGYFTENIIITPHLGEMARLTNKTVRELSENLIESAREYADKYGIICVLKDAVTVVALKDGRCYINSSGNSAMAKAGSGDTLTGILAGLLALGIEEDEAAALGVYIHGLAGDEMREQAGEHGLLARELAWGAAKIVKEGRKKEE